LTPTLVILAGIIGGAVGAAVAVGAVLPTEIQSPSFQTLRQMGFLSAPLLVVSFVGVFIDSIDVIIIGSLLSDLSQIGVYSVAYSLASYLRYLIEPVALVLLPLASSAIAIRNQIELKNIIRLASRMLVVLFMPLAILVAVLSREILSILFPPEFILGASTFTVLSISVTCLAVYYLYSRMLIAARKTRALATLLVICGVIDLILTLILVELFGMLGAGLSSAVTFFLLGFGSLFLTNRSLNTQSYFGYRDLFLGISLLLFFFTYQFLSQLIFNNFQIGSGIITVGIVLGTALFVEVLFKPIEAEECDVIISVVNGAITGPRLKNILTRIIHLFARSSTPMNNESNLSEASSSEN
jgi:O-antigen/teichoic acid export membrane protein